MSNELVERMARSLYDCEAERSAHADKIFAAARGQPVGQPSIEPYEECADVFRNDARTLLPLIEAERTAAIAAAVEAERERCAKVADKAAAKAKRHADTFVKPSMFLWCRSEHIPSRQGAPQPSEEA